MKITLVRANSVENAVAEMAARRSLYDVVEARIARGGHCPERYIPKRSTS